MWFPTKRVHFSNATNQQAHQSSGGLSSNTVEDSPTINQTLNKLNRLGNIKIGIVKLKKPADPGVDKVLSCIQKLSHINVKKEPDFTATQEPQPVHLETPTESSILHTDDDYFDFEMKKSNTEINNIQQQYDDFESIIEYDDGFLCDHDYETLSTEPIGPVSELTNEALVTRQPDIINASLPLDQQKKKDRIKSKAPLPDPDDCNSASCKICRPITEEEKRSDWQMVGVPSSQSAAEEIPPRKQPCNICPLEFVSDLALNTHYLCDHQDMIDEQIRNACMVCFQLFSNAKERTHHEQTLHYDPKTDQYVCRKCRYKNESLEMLTDHIAAKHKLWKCHHCCKSVRSYDRWLVHVIRHATAELLSLPSENVPSDTGKLLRLRECTCQICWKKFIGRKRMEIHEKLVHLNPVTNCLRCPMCEFETANRYALRDHTIGHAGCAPFVCDICGKGMNSKRMLQTHLMRHNRDFKCVICGKSFEFRNKLVRHEKYHTDVRPFKCHLCDKSYKDLTDLRRHKWSHGIGEAKIGCTICDKKFYEQKQLRHHMLSHKE